MTVAKAKRHTDGTRCLEGTRRVPRGFSPCCSVFDLHTTSCAYDIRYEWWQRHRIWVVTIADSAGGGGIEVSFCPHCGGRLQSTASSNKRLERSGAKARADVTVATFAECVSVLGPVRELPIADAVQAEATAVGELIPLSSPGIVSDGYYHWLRVHRVSGFVYIVQAGGIAGAQTVFGPFRAEHGCLAFPRRDRSPMLMELAWWSSGSERDV
jgi:hypothetical protein